MDYHREYYEDCINYLDLEKNKEYFIKRYKNEDEENKKNVNIITKKK